jgi:putative copper resistance protein D
MDPLVAAQIAVAAVQDILFAIAVGALACDAMTRRQAVAVPATPGRWRLYSFVLLVIACAFYLWLQAAVMSGEPLGEAGSALSAVLTQSHFGVAWSIGLAGAVLGTLAGARRTRGAWIVATTGAIVYAMGKAAASHAADAGDFSVPEAVHTVHLCATALWAGSIIVGTCMLFGSERTSPDMRVRRARFSAQLSQLATIALGVVVVTGIFNVVENTAHMTTSLLACSYGHVLSAKLVLVALAILLGGYNRLTYLPELRAGKRAAGMSVGNAQRRFDRLLLIEAVTMLAVLVVAASLGHTSPSGG